MSFVRFTIRTYLFFSSFVWWTGLPDAAERCWMRRSINGQNVPHAGYFWIWRKQNDKFLSVLSFSVWNTGYNQIVLPSSYFRIISLKKHHSNVFKAFQTEFNCKNQIPINSIAFQNVTSIQIHLGCCEILKMVQHEPLWHLFDSFCLLLSMVSATTNVLRLSFVFGVYYYFIFCS